MADVDPKGAANGNDSILLEDIVAGTPNPLLPAI
jgi:hypothetical protein